MCTLIHAPELVILDEPTTGVDPVSRRDFWAILAELLAEEQMTYLVSTAYGRSQPLSPRGADAAARPRRSGPPQRAVAHAPAAW
ncbi:MAG: hypothetical protein U1E47_02455 [Rivihabitans pingtungensis]